MQKIYLGSLGVTATSAGTIVSLQQHVEPVLRVISLLVGIAVGLVTLYKLSRK